MRKQPAPLVVLSGNAQAAVCVSGISVDLIDLGGGAATTLRLPHEATISALSPAAAFLAVAGYDRLSCFRCGTSVSLVTTIPLTGRLFRLAVGDTGLVVGAEAHDGAAAFHAWQGGKLQPLFPPDGRDLGRVAPYSLLLDATTSMVLLSGLAGQGAMSGNGTRFVRLAQFSHTGLQVLWGGVGSPIAEPNGYLFPLAYGRLGVYDRDRLIILDPIGDPKHPGRIIVEYAFGDLETVVASPAGTHIAWLWSNSAAEGFQIRAARLTDGTIIHAAAGEHLGRFPALAVTDEGRPVIAYGERPNHILAWTVSDDALVPLVDDRALSHLGL